MRDEYWEEGMKWDGCEMDGLGLSTDDLLIYFSFGFDSLRISIEEYWGCAGGYVNEYITSIPACRKSFIV